MAIDAQSRKIDDGQFRSLRKPRKCLRTIFSEFCVCPNQNIRGEIVNPVTQSAPSVTGGLLTPDALEQLIRAEVSRREHQRLRAMNGRTGVARRAPLTNEELNAEIPRRPRGAEGETLRLVLDTTSAVLGLLWSGPPSQVIDAVIVAW